MAGSTGADSGFVVAADVISEKELRKLFCFSDCVSEIVFFFLKKKNLILSQSGRSKPQTSNPGLPAGPCPGLVLAPGAGCRRGGAGVGWFSLPQSWGQWGEASWETLICCWDVGGPGGGETVGRPERGAGQEAFGEGHVSSRRELLVSKNATECLPKFYLLSVWGRLTLG